MPEAKQYSTLIKEEAVKLLESTNLMLLLGQFGEVDLGGSFAYDLMVDRDLDFGVAVSSITPEVRTEIAKIFAAQPWAYKVTIIDRVNFEPQANLGAPRGLYLGLIVVIENEYWNIDVWLIIGERVPVDGMAKLISNATQKQKDTILGIKYELMKTGQKEKGLTSSEVYKAVLLNNVSSTDEFLKI